MSGSVPEHIKHIAGDVAAFGDASLQNNMISTHRHHRRRQMAAKQITNNKQQCTFLNDIQTNLVTSEFSQCS